MVKRDVEPGTEEDYTIHVLPEDVALAVEALGAQALEACDDGRGEDVRRSFAAVNRLTTDIEESMYHWTPSGSDDDEE